MKNTANLITILRFGFAVAMMVTDSFSIEFWICYLCGGFSDILDGVVARVLKQQSEIGAKLDSIADLFFGAALSYVIISNVPLPIWTWVFIAFIVALRFIGYGIGVYKYHTFSSLHTYMNKLVGIFLFLFPLLYKVFDLNIVCTFLCLIAFISAVEEIIITLCSKELERNRKGLFFTNTRF
ncbi:MAG: CDP-alcohol phosphatidyltransferase family protein [Anaerostipes sp.]|nr:CDP-alcohol phosphatidyltransferase family protein [Anaerostipes sp.]